MTRVDRCGFGCMLQLSRSAVGPGSADGGRAARLGTCPRGLLQTTETGEALMQGRHVLKNVAVSQYIGKQMDTNVAIIYSHMEYWKGPHGRHKHIHPAITPYFGFSRWQSHYWSPPGARPDLSRPGASRSRRDRSPGPCPGRRHHSDLTCSPSGHSQVCPPQREAPPARSGA